MQSPWILQVAGIVLRAGVGLAQGQAQSGIPISFHVPAPSSTTTIPNQSLSDRNSQFLQSPVEQRREPRPCREIVVKPECANIVISPDLKNQVPTENYTTPTDNFGGIVIVPDEPSPDASTKAP